MDAFKKFARREVAFKALVPDRLRSGSTTNNDANVEEGFICPECHQRFAGSDALGLHYENTHMHTSATAVEKIDVKFAPPSPTNDTIVSESRAANEADFDVNSAEHAVQSVEDDVNHLNGHSPSNDDRGTSRELPDHFDETHSVGFTPSNECNGDADIGHSTSTARSAVAVTGSAAELFKQSTSHLDERVPTPFNYHEFDDNLIVSDGDDNSVAVANSSQRMAQNQNQTHATSHGLHSTIPIIVTTNHSDDADAVFNNNVADNDHSRSASSTNAEQGLPVSTESFSCLADETSRTPSPNMLLNGNNAFPSPTTNGEDATDRDVEHATDDEDDDDDEHSPVSHNVYDNSHDTLPPSSLDGENGEDESSSSAATRNLRAQLNASEELLQERTELLETFQSHNEQLQARLRAFEAKNATIERQLATMTADRDAVRLERESMRQQLADVEGDASERSDRIENITTQLASLTAAQTELAAQLAGSRRLLDEKSALVDQLQVSLDALSHKKASLEQTLHATSVERDKSLKELASAHDSINNGKNELERMQSERDKISRELQQMHAQYAETNTQLEKIRTDSEQKLITVQQTLKTTANARDSALARVTESNTLLLSAEAAHATTKRELDDAHTRMQEQREQQQAAIKSLQQQVYDAEHRIRAAEQLATERQYELDSLGAELKAEQDKRYSELSRYEQAIKEAELLRALAEESVTKIKRDVGERTARVMALERDKTSLLDKCLEKDESVDRLRGEVRELTRKWDDAVTAMQDLGRENQALKVEFNRLSSRKWVSDTEAGKCMGCDAAFGVSRRKHHCRNCGQVYCDTCSSKRVSLPSSKTPVRVCSKCCDELQSSK